MKSAMVWLVAVLCFAGAVVPQARAQESSEEEAAAEEAPPPKKAKRKAKAAAEEDEAPTHGFDKAALESYLKRRRSAIAEAHKKRMAMLDEELKIGQKFWTRIKDDRNQFELRVARQRLDLFESLASLDSEHHTATLTDFEKLQANMVRSFETGQKQKLAEYFAQRETRWKDFAAESEKERADFAVEAEEAWQNQKTSLKESMPEEEKPSKGKKRR